MQSHDKLSVCVAIPTYNREQVLIDTIQQVLKQEPLADEILVIDQTEEHKSGIEAYLSNADQEETIRWIKHSPANLNGARNRAVQETSCDILILIDDDVELVSGFIEKHARNYLDLSIVAVAGRTIQANGNTPAATSTPWVRPFGYEPFALDGTKRIEGVASFIGANLSVRVTSIREIGGFDENYHGPLYNESDAALRLCERGGVIVFDPEAEVYHKQYNDGGVREKQKKHPEYWMSFSTVYFHMKHFFPGWYFWKQVIFIQFRRRALRKEIVFRPWRIPWALLCYMYSFCLAIFLLTRGKPMLPNIGNNQEDAIK